MSKNRRMSTNSAGLSMATMVIVREMNVWRDLKTWCSTMKWVLSWHRSVFEEGRQQRVEDSASKIGFTVRVNLKVNSS